MNGREPRAGDLLSYEEVVKDRNSPLFAAFINAWNRKLPGLVCTLKLENGELHYRTVGDGSGEVWQEKLTLGRKPDGESSNGMRLATNLAPARQRKKSPLALHWEWAMRVVLCLSKISICLRERESGIITFTNQAVNRQLRERRTRL